MTTTLAHALRDAGLTTSPDISSLPPKTQRKKAADRMWLLANGLPTPEQSKRRDKIAHKAHLLSQEWHTAAWDSPGAATVYDALNRGRHIVRVVWPNGLAEEFDLFSKTDAAILAAAVNETPDLSTRCFAMPVADTHS